MLARRSRRRAAKATLEVVEARQQRLLQFSGVAFERLLLDINRFTRDRAVQRGPRPRKIRRNQEIFQEDAERPHLIERVQRRCVGQDVWHRAFRIARRAETDRSRPARGQCCLPGHHHAASDRGTDRHCHIASYSRQQRRPVGGQVGRMTGEDCRAAREGRHRHHGRDVALAVDDVRRNGDLVQPVDHRHARLAQCVDGSARSSRRKHDRPMPAAAQALREVDGRVRCAGLQVATGS